MSKQKLPVTLTIMSKEYKIMCSEEEQDDLISTAQQLDAQMRKIRLSGKVSGAERVAVLAALNLAHELTQAQRNIPIVEEDVQEHLQNMQDKIETALKNV